MDHGRAHITVTGTGRSARPADMARAVLVAEAVRDSAAAARAAAAATAGGILAAIRAAGVPDADVHTAGLDVVPNWEPDGARMVRTGFTVANRIAITIRDLEAVGRVLDAGLEAGATGLEGVGFLLADEAGASADARRAAVADARSRAETIAQAAGGRLGTLLAITEGGPDGAGPRPEARMFAMAADTAPTPVIPGAIEIAVSVTATWELLAPEP